MKHANAALANPELTEVPPRAGRPPEGPLTEYLRQTVKVEKFTLPADAFADPEEVKVDVDVDVEMETSQPEVTAPTVRSQRFVRPIAAPPPSSDEIAYRVAIALWVAAIALVGGLYVLAS